MKTRGHANCSHTSLSSRRDGYVCVACGASLRLGTVLENDMNVTNEIKLYEMDGVETKAIGGPSLLVKSHWVRREMVVLVIGGHEYTCTRRELEAAMGNATNTGSLY